MIRYSWQYTVFGWQQPSSWLWWWLLPRFSKRQSSLPCYQENSFSGIHSLHLSVSTCTTTCQQLFCSNLILMSFVICCWTGVHKHGNYLLNLLYQFIPQSINQDSQHSNASVSSIASDKEFEVAAYCSGYAEHTCICLVQLLQVCVWAVIMKQRSDLLLIQWDPFKFCAPTDLPIIQL